eukprot:15413488-Heterocapsa_arctica.AAC.1
MHIDTFIAPRDSEQYAAPVRLFVQLRGRDGHGDLSPGHPLHRGDDHAAHAVQARAKGALHRLDPRGNAEPI